MCARAILGVHTTLTLTPTHPQKTQLNLQCGNCKTKETTLWRRGGEENEIVLCNACGLYWKMHRQHRPEGLGTKGEAKKRNRKWTPNSARVAAAAQRTASVCVV